jgi:hypothetical protein
MNVGILATKERIFVQAVLLFCFAIFLFGSLNVSIKGILALVFLYQLVLSVLLYNYFLYVYGDPFGFNPVDSLFYLNLAEYALNHSLGDLISYMQSQNIEIADYGFPFIRFFIFKLAGSLNAGIVFMVFVNIISVTLGSWYLYKLSLFFLKNKSSKVVVLLWGLNSCSVYINVRGCKESIFVTLLIIAMYQLYSYYRKKNISSLFLSVIFIGATIFFRIWLTAFFVIIILFKPIYSGNCKRFALLMVIVLTIITTYANYFISAFSPVMERLLLRQENSSNRFGNMLLINMITGFLGPYPSILQSTDQNTFFWASYAGFKTFFSLFALYGGWYILKNQITKLYPLFFYIFFNILLVVGSVRSFSYRFSYTMIPFFFILIVYGFNHFRFKYKTIIPVFYFFIIFVLVYNYNILH